MERDTLKRVHEQLVKLLSEQCKERDEFLEELLLNSEESIKALLLQEVSFFATLIIITVITYFKVRRTNKLQHENTLLQQEVLLLRTKCDNFMNKQEKRNVPLK